MNRAEFKAWCASERSVTVAPHYRGKPLVMGILNITPDSFSDGGRYFKLDDAKAQAEKMIEDGADILDIGAESSRPGALPLDEEEELSRLMPVLEFVLNHYDIAISVDTYKPSVMRAAVSVGAAAVNDIFALQKPGALEVAASCDVPICLMHMKGSPKVMQDGLNEHDDVLLQTQHFFEARIRACIDAGISQDRLILDPGFGFGKTVRQNLKLTKNLSVFHRYGLPLLLGVSRKSTIGAVLERDVENRLPGGLALSIFAAIEGVGILRTHDVASMQDALKMIHVMLQDNDLDKEIE